MESLGAVAARDWLDRLPAHIRQRAAEVVIPEGETAEDVAARHRLQAENRASRWRARLPVMYAEARLVELGDDQHAQAIFDWVGDSAADSPTLLLAGTVGAGKTHAAYAVGNASVLMGRYVAALTTHDLLEAMRPGGDAALATDAHDADVLVLDDLTANVAQATPWAQDSLLALLDKRLREGKRQVVTTNSRSAELAEAWGDRTVDRLLYRARVLVFRGESRRERF